MAPKSIKGGVTVIAGVATTGESCGPLGAVTVWPCDTVAISIPRTHTLHTVLIAVPIGVMCSVYDTWTQC